MLACAGTVAARAAVMREERLRCHLKVAYSYEARLHSAVVSRRIEAEVRLLRGLENLAEAGRVLATQCWLSGGRVELKV